MRAPLLINLVACVVMLGVSCHRAVEGALQFYPATIPTLVQAGLGGLIALAGLTFVRKRFVCLFISSAALGLLGLPAFYAMSQWPGGDDGGGMGWLFIVGGGCAVSLVVALVTVGLGILELGRPRQHSGAPVQLSDAPSQDRVPAPAQPSPSGTAGRWREDKAARVLLWGILGLAGVLLVWLIAGPIRWTTTRTAQHAGGIELRSIDVHELMPFPLPFFHHVSPDAERILLVQGREVMRSRAYVQLFPSPAGMYVVAAHLLQSGPLRIYTTADGHLIEIVVENSDKEFPDHHYVYPFRFVEWENENSFLIEVCGTDFSDRSLRKYRQVWRVDATTGARKRIE